MRRISIGTSCLLLFLLSSCVTSRSDDVIFEKVCNLPCWANITPGASNESEVKTLQDDIPKINVNQKIWKERQDGYDLFKWQFIDSEKQNGTIYIYNNVVESIILFGEYRVSLDRLVNNYGDPDYVIVGNTITPGILGSGYQNQVNLIYEDGMIISLQPNKNAYIKPTTKIDQVVFFDPVLSEKVFQKWISVGILGEVIIWEWQGFGQFTLEGKRK